MKIGIVTDVHGNLEALQAVLHAMDAQRVDVVWSLGDMIAMGPDSNAVMERLLERGAHMISGNHDEAVISLLAGHGHPDSYAHTRPHHEWVARHLDTNYMDVLESLPRTITTELAGQTAFGIHYHIPNEKWEATIVEEPFHDILEPTLENMQRLYGEYAGDVILFGHHHPVHLFEDDTKCYVNPGALGVARDELARFAILSEGETGIRLDLKAVPYDKRTFLEKMERHEVPQRDVMMRLFY
ncbi:MULTISPECIES: metallophosphoesterase family protein [unclassified Exiguobacterium]|uniref:metallophosphoesterase family protein n=1 Tax=unclassified Exiguobacterium TaxID=2644629 RepID=UPI001BE7CB46|nr:MULTISPECIES: metallophosphoesterase family protein [unclassified Exiguobacterium]